MLPLALSQQHVETRPHRTRVGSIGRHAVEQLPHLRSALQILATGRTRLRVVLEILTPGLGQSAG
jgi:hypothetical protein